jgi:hypothetical protein
MKSKTDQWIESNIYRDTLEAMLKHLRCASVADKMTVRRYCNTLTDEFGKMLIDSVIMASMLALVNLGWAGTEKNATRIPKFVEEVRGILEDLGERMGESTAQALYNRLYDLGVEYDLSDSPWAGTQNYRA